MFENRFICQSGVSRKIEFVHYFDSYLPLFVQLKYSNGLHSYIKSNDQSHR